MVSRSELDGPQTLANRDSTLEKYSLIGRSLTMKGPAPCRSFIVARELFLAPSAIRKPAESVYRGLKDNAEKASSYNQKATRLVFLVFFRSLRRVRPIKL
jgi:hypothetical protein